MAYDADGNYYWQPDDPIKASTDTSYLKAGATNWSTPGMFGSWGGQAPEAQSQQLIGSPGSYNFANVTDTLNNFASKYKLPTNWNWADAWRAGGGNSGVDLISPLSATARYLLGLDKLQGTNAYGEWVPTIDTKYWAAANAAQAEAKGRGDQASGLNLGQWITPMAEMGGLMGGAGMLSNYLGAGSAGAVAPVEGYGTGAFDAFTGGADGAGGALSEAGGAGGAGAGGGGGVDFADWVNSFGGGGGDSAFNPNAWSSYVSDAVANGAAPGGTVAETLNGYLGSGGGGLFSNISNLPTSVIKSIFGTNDAGAASIAKTLGTALGGFLDYNASSKQADAMKAIADRSWAAGQPYRDRANAAMTPGFDIKSIPGLSSAMDTATETYLRKLSATGGNPAGIGAAPSQTEAFVLGNVALPAWQNYFNANSNAGGLSNLSAQANGTAQNAAAADAGIYGSLGQTARNIFDPQPNNTQYLRSIFGLA